MVCGFVVCGVMCGVVCVWCGNTGNKTTFLEVRLLSVAINTKLDKIRIKKLPKLS